MSMYKGVEKQEREFWNRKTKDILNNYKEITYQGTPIHEILFYKSFFSCRGDSAGYQGRTAIYNKTLLKQLDYVLVLIKEEKAIPQLLPTCFVYERALIEQSHNGAKVREINERPVNQERLKELQETMKGYESKLKLYESENGISIAYEDYIESAQYILKEDKDLFGMVKHAYLITTEKEINKILEGVQRLKDYSQKVYNRYLSYRR
jgi:hypothetical protein